MKTINFIEETNLSAAWLQALNQILNGRGNEITPLILTLTGFDETMSIRKALDSHLLESKLGSTQTVSETIFPNSLYDFCGKDRHKLYEIYQKNLPRMKKIDPVGNGKGTYFERMIAFEGGNRKINQLEVIISSINAKSNKRRSKLQASIFDPRVDHTDDPYGKFPCLQHVTCSITESGGLVLNSFYAIQYLYRRGYGNWLGLINLGKFIANETNVEFERFNCFIGVEKLELTKTQAKEILLTFEEIN